MNHQVKNIIKYFLFSVFGIIMVYPLLWLSSASFKPNEEFFTSLNLIPSRFVLDSYVKGWQGIGQFTFSLFFFNTFKLVIPTVAFTVLSSTIVAYGFARFKFPMKKILFTLMLSTLMLPNAVVIIPKYMLFKNFDWLDSYLPITIPALFGCYPFFIFMLVQFFKGIPLDLDEAATIDGCNSFGILIKILIPLCIPAIISAAIFQFIWTWGDFFNVFVFVNSISKYTVPLALNMAVDNMSSINWNQLAAVSFLSILPPLLVFFFAQKYFIEGVTTTGMKT